MKYGQPVKKIRKLEKRMRKIDKKYALSRSAVEKGRLLRMAANTERKIQQLRGTRA